MNANDRNAWRVCCRHRFFSVVFLCFLCVSPQFVGSEESHTLLQPFVRHWHELGTRTVRRRKGRGSFFYKPREGSEKRERVTGPSNKAGAGMWGNVAAIVRQTSLERTQHCFHLLQYILSHSSCFTFLPCWLASSLFQSNYFLRPQPSRASREQQQQREEHQDLRLVTQLTVTYREIQNHSSLQPSSKALVWLVMSPTFMFLLTLFPR